MAYKYLMANTSFPVDMDATVQRPVENYAFVTKDGVYVLPTKGVDIDGEEFKNYGNSAEWRVLDYKLSEKGMSIQYNGKWSNVLATIHTHPGVAYGGVGSSHGGEDKRIMNHQGVMSIVFSSNGMAYGMYPGSNSSIPIAPHSDFRNGTISIIRHYN